MLAKIADQAIDAGSPIVEKDATLQKGLLARSRSTFLHCGLHPFNRAQANSLPEFER
jgi:hypothetical protein